MWHFGVAGKAADLAAATFVDKQASGKDKLAALAASVPAAAP